MEQGNAGVGMPTGSGTIYCVCGGTRGDQQPVVMIAAQLQRMGYKIVLSVGPEGKAWAEVYGFDIIELESFEDIVRQNDGMVEAAETGDFQTFFTNLGKAVAENLAKDIPSLFNRMKADSTVAGLLVTSTHSSICEPMGRKLGIHCTALYLSPFSPTVDYPPYFIDRKDPATWPMEDKPSVYPEEMNKPLWTAMLDSVCRDFTQVCKAATEATDAKDLMPKDDDGVKALLINLVTRAPPDPKGPAVINRTCDVLYGYSDAFGASDATPEVKQAQTGFVWDAATTDHDKTMSHFDDKLQAFLKSGDAPVYLGWGSMCRKKNDELVRAAVTACKISGKRGIILYGWAHLELDMLDKSKDAELFDYAKDNILFVKHVSHIKLFPECCCVISHGGAGTTAAMVRGGRPCIVTPVWWDQIFFGDRVEAMGMGKRGPHFAKVSGENLAELITEVTSDPSYGAKAKEVAEKLLAQEPGDAVAARLIHQGIQVKQGKPGAKYREAPCGCGSGCTLS